MRTLSEQELNGLISNYFHMAVEISEVNRASLGPLSEEEWQAEGENLKEKHHALKSPFSGTTY